MRKRRKEERARARRRERIDVLKRQRGIFMGRMQSSDRKVTELGARLRGMSEGDKQSANIQRAKTSYEKGVIEDRMRTAKTGRELVEALKTELGELNNERAGLDRRLLKARMPWTRKRLQRELLAVDASIADLKKERHTLEDEAKS